jgi:hypothetical protein
MPFDARSLTPEMCVTNETAISASFGLSIPQAETLHAATVVPAAHTLGSQSAWSVFLLSPGLQCIAIRDPDELEEKLKDPRSPWHLCKSVGLHRYVFAYLGCHQPYYAIDPGVHQYPIGIFISVTATESVANPGLINATLRDLAVGNSSPAMISPPHHRYFVSSAGARSLCAREVAARYSNKFWKYWGDCDEEGVVPDIINGDHWKQLYEFHYLYELPSAHFEAVLWPATPHYGAEGNVTWMPLAPGLRMHRQHPSLRIFLYDSTADDPNAEFVQRTYTLAKHLVNKGLWPRTWFLYGSD